MAKLVEKTAPVPAYEFVMTQLILRANGIKTSEMDVMFTIKDVNKTTVDLRVTQGDKIEIIVIGSLNLAESKVKKMWAYWTEVAAEQIITNFDTYQKRSQVFKCVDILLKHLVKLGFNLQDTPIIETHDVKGTIH